MESGEAWLSEPSLELGDIEIYTDEIWNAGYDNVNAASNDYVNVRAFDGPFQTEFAANLGGQSYSEVLSHNLICGPALKHCAAIFRDTQLQ
jgi:hypothetical protein